jgi:hypothetical protein
MVVGNGVATTTYYRSTGGVYGIAITTQYAAMRSPCAYHIAATATYKAKAGALGGGNIYTVLCTATYKAIRCRAGACGGATYVAGAFGYWYLSVFHMCLFYYQFLYIQRIDAYLVHSLWQMRYGYHHMGIVTTTTDDLLPQKVCTVVYFCSYLSGICNLVQILVGWFSLALFFYRQKQAQ